MSFRSDSPLLSLIKNKDNEKVKSYIMRKRLHKAVDESKNTLLHYAAGYGNPEIVQFLLGSGSKVDAKNDLKQTPLIRSLITDSPCKDVVEFLLNEASIVHKDNVCQNAIDIVNSIVWLEGDIRRFEILKIFLERTTDMMFYRILWEADKNIIRSLLHTDISLFMVDSYKRTLVHMLALNPNPGAIEQLRGRNVNLDVFDGSHQTPLIYAIRKDNISAVEFLLNEGADVESTSVTAVTALHLAISLRNKNNNTKRIVQVLLDHGGSVQVCAYNKRLDYIETIFDLVSNDQNFELAELLLAHLAFDQALGITVTDLIRIRINESSRLKSYFDICQKQISTQIKPSISLIDVLTASDKELEIYLRNKELASKLIDYKTSICYYNNKLHERISRASRMVELRKIAAEIFGKLARIDYNSYPYVFDEIANYFGEQDMKNLISIQDTVF